MSKPCRPADSIEVRLDDPDDWAGQRFSFEPTAPGPQPHNGGLDPHRRGPVDELAELRKQVADLNERVADLEAFIARQPWVRR